MRGLEGTLDRLPAVAGTNAPPFTSLVTLADAKALARRDDDDEDALIGRLCTVATEAVAEYTRLELARRQWAMEVLDWPFRADRRSLRSAACWLYLRGPVLDAAPVVSLQYRAQESDVWTALDEAQWSVQRQRMHTGAPARIRLAQAVAQHFGYRVIWWRGWARVEDVPATLVQAATAVVGQMLSNREISSDFPSFDGRQMTMSIRSMLGRFKLRSVGGVGTPG